MYRKSIREWIYGITWTQVFYYFCLLCKLKVFHFICFSLFLTTKKLIFNHQVWIYFKPIYNTLESQTIFVRGLRPKTPATGAAYSTPQTFQLNLTHFACVRLARLASNHPQIVFLYSPPGVKTQRWFSQKNLYTTYIQLGKNTSKKVGIFKMKLSLSKSSPLLQRMVFLVIVFVSYSRKKLLQ